MIDIKIQAERISITIEGTVYYVPYQQARLMRELYNCFPAAVPFSKLFGASTAVLVCDLQHILKEYNLRIRSVKGYGYILTEVKHGTDS